MSFKLVGPSSQHRSSYALIVEGLELLSRKGKTIALCRLVDELGVRQSQKKPNFLYQTV